MKQVAISVIVLLCFLSNVVLGSELQPLENGTAAPDFKLRQLNGEWVKLSDFRGMVVVINFWAAWCPPCRVAMLYLDKLSEAIGEQDLTILNIATYDKGEEGTRAFATEQGLKIPILLDSTFIVANKYGVKNIPLTYILDRNGTIVKVIRGARDWGSSESLDMVRGIIRR